MTKRSVSSSLISHFVMLALIVAGVSFACISTPTPEPTEVPTPTKAPPEPTEVPPEPTETIEVAPVESWRMPPLPGSVLASDDTSGDPEWEEIVAERAKNLAIPAPYFWEVFAVPEGTVYDEVKTHYNEIMTEQLYKKARDEQGQNNIFLLTFLHETNKDSKNAIVFYPIPAVLVIYSNPIE